LFFYFSFYSGASAVFAALRFVIYHITPPNPASNTTATPTYTPHDVEELAGVVGGDDEEEVDGDVDDVEDVTAVALILPLGITSKTMACVLSHAKIDAAVGLWILPATLSKFRLAADTFSKALAAAIDDVVSPVVTGVMDVALPRTVVAGNVPVTCKVDPGPIKYTAMCPDVPTIAGLLVTTPAGTL
jgi:hypothetical protein